MRKQDEQLQEFAEANAKLTLWCAQQARMVKGMLAWCCRLELKPAYEECAKKEAKTFIEAQQRLLKDKDNEEVDRILGPMHLWVFNGVIKAGLSDPKLSMEDKTKMEEGIKVWATMEKSRMCLEITHCKVSKMYQSDVKRLEMGVPMSLMHKTLDKELGCMSPTSVWLVIQKMLRQQPKFRELPGVAPRLDLERKLKDLLEGK